MQKDQTTLGFFKVKILEDLQNNFQEVRDFKDQVKIRKLRAALKNNSASHAS